MTPDLAASVFERVQQFAALNVELTDKDKEVLGRLVNSEPVLKGLAQVVRMGLNGAGDFFKSANVLDPAQQMQVLRLQGSVDGTLLAVQNLINLAIVEEDEEEDNSDDSR